MKKKENPIENLIITHHAYRSFDKYRRGDNPSSIDLLRLFITGFLFEPLYCIIFNYPGSFGLLLRKVVCRIFMKNIGYRSLIDAGVKISGFSNISIDEYSWIDKNVDLLADTGFINIGKRVHIAPNANLVGLGGILIEDYAAVGRFAQVLSHSVVSENGKLMSGPMITEDIKGSKSELVILRKNSVVSSGAIIMPGVEIGEGAIIGPNSLILSNVKPWNIMLGNPARAVGLRESF